MKSKQFEKAPVSIIIPMRNSQTTILHTLESLNKQDYPISEIIIVDNASSDNSIEVVEKYIGINKKNLTSFIKHKKNKGVGASYNEGSVAAKSKLLVFMHSDSNLPTVKELSKLITPMKDEKVVASYSSTVLPEEVWNSYNFWLKCLMIQGVGKENSGLNGKFDCIIKKVFLDIGGYDTVNFGHHVGIGSDDADLNYRLQKKGIVAKSKARIVHLHYLSDDFSLFMWIAHRKLLARSYGRLIRLHFYNLGFKGLLFGIMPFLVLVSIVPVLFPYNAFLILVYTFLYMKKMYKTPSVLFNPRILLLPFITVFLVYYETFWMIEAFLYSKKEV